MSTIRIDITISAEEIRSLRALQDTVAKMRRDWIILDMALMRRRHGPLRYLMPRWWRLRKLMNQRTASAA